MALVDTGSELNIILEDSAIKAGLTTRCLNMNLRGIGEHCTSKVGLAEFTPITLVTGEERDIHFFVARGAVHTVLGRPFLADNNIRLHFSQQKGEIFSYIEPDGRILCLPICSPQKKELPKEKELRPKNQYNFVENSHQVLDSEEVKDSKDKVKIHEELAPISTEDIKSNSKERNVTGILTSRKENGNTCNQASQAINSYNFRNPENRWKSSIKPVVTIISVTSESKGSSSQIDKSALKALKEVSLKDNISKKKDIITPNHLKIQEENIDIIPKSEEYSGLNEMLNDTIENSHHNKNTYPQEISISNEGASKTINKHTFHQRATHKQKFSNLEDPQISFPSNLENIDPRILMGGISGENKSYSNIENIDPRLIREELELTRIIENPIKGNKQKQVKNMPLCPEEESSKIDVHNYTLRKEDMEGSIERNMQFKKFKNEFKEGINLFGQIDIQQELNKQKHLHPEDRSSGEAYNKFYIEKEINSRFKKLKYIRNNATNELIQNTINSPNSLEKHFSEFKYENEAGLLCKLEMKEEAEDEHKFILTEEEYPQEGYTNWQPLRNANLFEQNNNNPRSNYECANQHVKWLEDIIKPKRNKSGKKTDKSSKKKKKTKAEKEYLWITQNKKICPSLQAHLARQYKTTTQKGDWTKDNDRNGKRIQDYFDNNEDFQDQYLNEEIRNELPAKKAKFKKGLDNKFSYYQ
ncbi:hypothetical protein O181_095338 [Austropuccinia psidii MF-1]|uniref:Peptidase A2 domain-containing protein n=1 Tax=Austropuccinia psidii MF-1 TaxID=1389203 RepID=A0A9Q3J3M8_9BASI|nr:hypothetical protein [Austropuccinia psidii MF-1]